jgi:hypothetical protein
MYLSRENALGRAASDGAEENRGFLGGQGVEVMKTTILSVLLLIVPCALAHAGEPVPPVFLTHFYVALDPASYDALRSSPRIAALAGGAENSVVAGNRKWSGFYLYGHHTYMEFFSARALPADMRAGDTGLGLTVEEAGGVTAIAARLRTVYGERVEMDTTPSTSASGDIPWFTSTDIKSAGPEALSTWFMEVAPGFLAARHPGEPIEHPLSREQYLKWRFRPERPLDDVVGLTASLDPAAATQLATELELVGWAVRRGAGGFVAVGPDVKLTVVPAGSRAGIQQVELRLRHSVLRQKIELGNAQLLLDGLTGRLIFF